MQPTEPYPTDSDRRIDQVTPALVALRRALHAEPELSGREEGTAARLAAFFAGCGADRILTGIGGEGLAAVFDSGTAGPVLGFRCELDALPIVEGNAFDHRSRHQGVAHLCGHDGHMSMVAGLGLLLQPKRPARGQVVLLCQPAEETGAGGPAFCADPAFQKLRLDWVFALHNLPGVPLGTVVTRSGVFCCASRGVAIYLQGRTAHASSPEEGLSPALPMCRLVASLQQLPDRPDFADVYCLVTVVGARLGEAAFGTAPGDAVVWATLRSETDETMARLLAAVQASVADAVGASGLTWRIEDHDVFTATVNHGAAVAEINAAARALGLTRREMTEPHRFSEDFGCFTRLVKGAMFGLGAGLVPSLHSQNYDFPDALIPVGLRLYRHLVNSILGW